MNAALPAGTAVIAPGVYYNLPAAVYHAAPALSSGGLKSLEVSQLRFWHDFVDPDREPRAETAAMKLGTALHAAVLEPKAFREDYATFVSKDDFEGCLETVADLKAWLQERHFTVKASMNKPDLIAAAQRIDPMVPILEIELRRHTAMDHDKILLDKAEMKRVKKMAKALTDEDELSPILSRGRSEVSVFAADPETGVLLKCRVDWLSDGTILDLKTFSSQGATIDDAIARALRYRGYIRQARFYTDILRLAGLGEFTWINAFVESDAPYEVRLRSMDPRAKYWEQTGADIRKLITRYASAQRFFGTARQWAYHQFITPVRDSEVRVWADDSYEGDQ